MILVSIISCRLIDYGTRFIKSELSSLEFDEYRLNEINDRIDIISRLKRKYKTDVQGLIDLKEELKKLTSKEVQINIYEIKRPEFDAEIVAANVPRQIENKVAYRRAVKMAIASTMRMGAEGIKIQVSGRLNGAEMARSEMFKEGRTPLHTLRADIDYALVEALTKVGIIGVKVWICRGEVYGKRELTPQYVVANKENGRGQGKGGRKGGFSNKKNNNR